MVLDVGCDFVGRGLPGEYTLGTPKQCFQNSYDLCIADEGLTYCEGYVLSDKLPMPLDHAWCVDAEGKVVDVTLADPIGWEYCGVMIKKEYMQAVISKRGYYGVLDNWQHQWPLLTGEHLWEDAVILHDS